MPQAPRPLPATLSLIVLACMATACAKENTLMEKLEVPKTNVRKVFPDARVAELAAAAANSDSARVHQLAAGVDLDVHGDKNVTLLQWAVLNRSQAGLMALLKEGADPAEQGMDGYTVMHTAAMVDDPAYLDTLLKSGADANVPDAEGQPPISAAITAKRDQQFRALLSAHADPNRADSIGDTPLHVAGLANDAGYALALLEAGANPSARNVQGVNFQKYLFQTRSELLNEQARREREAVKAWLVAHGVAVESDPR